MPYQGYHGCLLWPSEDSGIFTTVKCITDNKSFYRKYIIQLTNLEKQILGIFSIYLKFVCLCYTEFIFNTEQFSI